MGNLERWFISIIYFISVGSPLNNCHFPSVCPLATLLPMVSVGVFSAIVEATLRKPKVRDFQTMDEDIKSLKNIYKNRVLRVFLVFVLASLGGMIGNFVGGLEMFRHLL